jgi:membrane protein implicated in regulation of membrane protease activity
MARLRAEQEAREYAAMIAPPPPLETFTQRFPNAHAIPFQTTTQAEQEEDELVYADVSRQVALIFNVIISIVCCAGAIWWAAKWWSTPARLALSMAGSLLVAVAEVAVYAGYIKRVGDAKQKERSVGEVKEVVRTWVVGGDLEGEVDQVDEHRTNVSELGLDQLKIDEDIDVGHKNSISGGLKERRRREG